MDNAKDIIDKWRGGNVDSVHNTFSLVDDIITLVFSLDDAIKCINYTLNIASNIDEDKCNEIISIKSELNNFLKTI